jgi:hypothetical protein
MPLTRTRRRFLIATLVVASLLVAMVFRKTGDTNPVFAHLEQHRSVARVLLSACAWVGLEDEFRRQIGIAAIAREIRQAEESPRETHHCSHDLFP